MADPNHKSPAPLDLEPAQVQNERFIDLLFNPEDGLTSQTAITLGEISRNTKELQHEFIDTNELVLFVGEVYKQLSRHPRLLDELLALHKDPTRTETLSQVAHAQIKLIGDTAKQESADVLRDEVLNRMDDSNRLVDVAKIMSILGQELTDNNLDPIELHAEETPNDALEHLVPATRELPKEPTRIVDFTPIQSLEKGVLPVRSVRDKTFETPATRQAKAAERLRKIYDFLGRYATHGTLDMDTTQTNEGRFGTNDSLLKHNYPDLEHKKLMTEDLEEQFKHEKALFGLIIQGNVDSLHDVVHIVKNLHLSQNGFETLIKACDYAIKPEKREDFLQALSVRFNLDVDATKMKDIAVCAELVKRWAMYVLDPEKAQRANENLMREITYNKTEDERRGQTIEKSIKIQDLFIEHGHNAEEHAGLYVGSFEYEYWKDKWVNSNPRDFRKNSMEYRNRYKKLADAEAE